MSAVQEKTISDLISEEAILAVQDGNHGEKHPKSSDYVESGIHFVMANDLNSGSIDFKGCNKITENLASKLRIGFSKEGDVLLTHKGTIGNVAIVGPVEPYVMLTPQVTYYRTNDDKLLNRYLAYAFREPMFQKRMKSLAQQSTRPYIGITAQRNLKILWTERKMQDSVVNILSKYDDLIENNKRRIELLEESARQLYKEWFVRLRFPGHEHVKIIDGVPEGWSKGCVSDLGEVITGKTPSTKVKENFGGDIPFIKTPDMHASSIIFEPEEYLSERGANTQANKYLPKFSILVACIGARLGVVSLNACRCQTNQQINAVIPNSENYTFYAYLTLNGFREKLLAIGGGATMPNVNKSKFSGMDMLLPPDSLLESFHDMVAQSFIQMEKLIEMNTKLAQARDLLLPKLMNGEVAV